MSLRIYGRHRAPTKPGEVESGLGVLSGEPARAQSTGPDGYVGSLSKLIPAEVATAYGVLVGLLTQAPAGGLVAVWAVVALLILLTPAYVLFRGQEDNAPPIIGQAIFTTLIFVVWAYLIGGPFETLSWYNKFWGSLALVALAATGPLVVKEFPANQHAPSG